MINVLTTWPNDLSPNDLDMTSDLAIRLNTILSGICKTHNSTAEGFTVRASSKIKVDDLLTTMVIIAIEGDNDKHDVWFTNCLYESPISHMALPFVFTAIENAMTDGLNAKLAPELASYFNMLGSVADLFDKPTEALNHAITDNNSVFAISMKGSPDFMERLIALLANEV